MRGSGDHLDPGGILYGSIASRDRKVNLLSPSPNPETILEIERLITQIQAGDPGETLKLLNRHKDLWRLPALARLSSALAEQCVADRYPVLWAKGPALQSKVLALTARAMMEQSCQTKRLTTRDLRELFFETEALTHAPYNPDGDFRRELHRRIFDRSKSSLEHNRQDRWLDQGLLPLLAEAAAKEQLGRDDWIDLDQAVQALLLTASGGGYKAMAPWSHGHKGWITAEKYIFGFYKTVYGSTVRVIDADVGYDDANRRIMIAARERFEQQLYDRLREQRLASMSDIAELARASLAEACVSEMINGLRERPYAEIMTAFRPDASCGQDMRDAWREMTQKRSQSFPEAAIAAGLKAYHRLGEYSACPDTLPRTRMTKAFITAAESDRSEGQERMISVPTAGSPNLAAADAPRKNSS